ncbi:MAG: adenylosuccinate synthase [Fimbriimonadaceae bacterium]|nr:adenylosuccinate synthase [Fimbriimonadaceae bacterium]
MPTLVIVGAQWGDEAKGKMIDVLGSDSSVVVRYSGGNNAGHTVIFGGREFKFHLLPAGILHPGTLSVLGSGMVLCPSGLLKEIDDTRAKQAELGDLLISAAAHVVLPHHRRLDALEEEARGKGRTGTTSRGIGPAYTDKVQRIGIRMADLVDGPRFRERLEAVLEFKNRLITLLGGEPFAAAEVYDEYAPMAERLAPWVGNAEAAVQNAVAAGQHVLFEGAQGAFLDLDHGTYPYVTSSHPVAGGACLGTGIGPRDIDNVLGVAKVYCTRVGEGPFPTELDNEIGARIREAGHEYGTTTGRPRRCGWLDLAALRHSCRINSLSGLVMTRLDTLSGFPEVKASVGYEGLDGMPQTETEWREARPIWRTFPGWTGDLRSCRRREDLPAECLRYLEAVEEFTGTPAAILSVGPDREETMILRPDLVWG